MDILSTINNRDLALYIWGALFCVYALSHKAVRKTFLEVLKTLNQGFVKITFLLMLIYIGGLLFLFSKAGLWNTLLLKDTVYWFIGTAFILFVNLNNVHRDENFFGKLFLDTMKFTAVITFIINFYTFGFWVEFLMLPVIFVLVGMRVVAEQKPEFKSVYQVTSSVLAFFGICIAISIVSQLLTNSQKLFTLQNFEAFRLPLLLTMCYMPFLYIAGLVIAYDAPFHYIDVSSKGDKALARFAKWKIFALCHLNLWKLRRFVKVNPPIKFMSLRNKDQVRDLIREFRRVQGAV